MCTTILKQGFESATIIIHNSTILSKLQNKDNKSTLVKDNKKNYSTSAIHKIRVVMHSGRLKHL